MYGNSLGWLISGIIVVVMATLLVALQKLDTISPPTSFARNANVLRPLPAIPGMNDVVAMTDTGDAGPAYQQAIASYRRNERAYDKFLHEQKTDPAILAALEEGFDAIKAGTHLSKMSLFEKEPAAVINYDSLNTPVVAIQTVGLAACHRGLFIRKENPKEAMALFEAAFSLGAKLFNERVTYDECFAGLSIMGSATKYLEELSRAAGDTARADAVKAFEQQRFAYYETNLKPMASVVTPIDAGVLGRHVGDLFVIADQSQERMWRVEAIRKLGIVRFASMTGKRKGDQLGAARVARKYSQDADPILATAGQVAIDLKDVNQLR